MVRSLLVLCLTAGLASAAPIPVAEKVEAPQGPPPQFVYVSAVDRDKETVTVLRTVEVPVQSIREEEVKVIVNGVERVEKRKVFVTEMQMKQMEMVHPLKNVTATTAGGQKLTREELWNRLAAKKVILITWNPGEVDAAYRSVLQKDVLVVRMPLADVKGGAPLPPRELPRPMPGDLPPPPRPEK